MNAIFGTTRAQCARRAVVLLILAMLIVTELIVQVRPIAVNNGSMRPNIPVYSMVLAVPQDHYKVGDIITFQSGTEAGVVTHRLHAMGPDGIYVTKGDFNNDIDRTWTIGHDQVIGRVTALRIPRIGVWTIPAFWKWKVHQKRFWGGLLMVLVALIGFWLLGAEPRRGRHRVGRTKPVPIRPT